MKGSKCFGSFFALVLLLGSFAFAEKKTHHSADEASTQDNSSSQATFQKAMKLASKLPNGYSKALKTGKTIVRLLEECSSTPNESCLVELGNIYFYSKYKVPADAAKAVSLYQRAVKLFGNAEALRMLAIANEYAIGIGRQAAPNVPLALAYYAIAAYAKDHIALSILAYKYANGLNVVKNTALAAHLYKQAALHVVTAHKQGIPARTWLKLRLPEPADYENSMHKKNDALTFYSYNAERGDVNSQVLLGKIFYHGSDGFIQDESTAFHYFKMAAEQGNETAKGYIGLAYAKGEVTPQNTALALSLCTEAAKHGIAPAFHCLGMLHERGEASPAVTTPDFEAAIKCYVKGSEKDFAESHYRLGMLLIEYVPSFSIPKSIQYLILAARHGHILAIWELALLSLKNSTDESTSKALFHFRSAVERGPIGALAYDSYHAYHCKNKDFAFVGSLVAASAGYDSACVNAAFLAEEAKQWDLAMVLWNRAANLASYPAAYVRVGDLFYFGRSSSHTPDYRTAMRYYSAAERQENAEGAYSLAWMYEMGLGLVGNTESAPPDYNAALRYYTRAQLLSKDAFLAVWIALRRIQLKRNLVKFRSVFRKALRLSVVTAVMLVIGLLVRLVFKRPLESARRERREGTMQREEIEVADERMQSEEIEVADESNARVQSEQNERNEGPYEPDESEHNGKCEEHEFIEHSQHKEEAECIQLIDHPQHTEQPQHSHQPQLIEQPQHTEQPQHSHQSQLYQHAQFIEEPQHTEQPQHHQQSQHSQQPLPNPLPLHQQFIQSPYDQHLTTEHQNASEIEPQQSNDQENEDEESKRNTTQYSDAQWSEGMGEPTVQDNGKDSSEAISEPPLQLSFSPASPSPSPHPPTQPSPSEEEIAHFEWGV